MNENKHMQRSVAMISINNNILKHTIDGDVYLYNCDTGCFYTMDEIGMFMYDKASENVISEEDLISATCKHYNIAADDAETLEELRDFLKDMFDEKILMHVD